MTLHGRPQRDLALQGHYAGMLSRFLAYLVDVFLIGLLFAIGTRLTIAALEIVTGHHWDALDHRGFTAVAFFVWSFLYLTLSLAAGGRTPGMALLGLLMVRTSGDDLDLAHAALRTLVFPLSFLLFGIGFLFGLVRRDRKCLQDMIGGTVIVYGWDARAARVRFLAFGAGAQPR